MNKLIKFFTGLFLMLITCGILVATSMIYDYGDTFAVQPYFFQPDNLSENRAGSLSTLDEMGASRMRDILLSKFITEYFYITPDADNINRRTQNTGTLARMSSSDVFKQWKDGEAKKIKELANKDVMRSVRVVGEIINPTGDDDGYWVAEYELQTWQHPNKMDEMPVISHGKLYMKIRYELGLVPNIPLERMLDNYDSATVFKFIVIDIEDYPE